MTRHILSARNISVLAQTHETFSTGLDLYSTRLDKGYSTTDCISMQAMRREGLTDMLTRPAFRAGRFPARYSAPDGRCAASAATKLSFLNYLAAPQSDA